MANQRHPEGQVEPCAGLALGLDDIMLQDEHIQQADRHANAHAAQQHQTRPRVLDQQQVNSEQLRVQRREERQPDERRVDGRSNGDYPGSVPRRTPAP
jgi:hypothetical protein